MLLSKTLNPFLYAFYLLGQSPFPTTTSSVSRNYFKRFLFKLPVSILICVSVYVTVHFISNDYSAAWDNPGLNVIHVLLITSSLITNLVIGYQCLFRALFWIKLQEAFGELETEFLNLLPNKIVKLAKFRNVFLFKCFAMLISYLVLMLAMTMSRLTNEYFNTSYMIVLAFINDLCAFQVVFYVDLIKFFLKTITHTFRDGVADIDKCATDDFSETKFLTSVRTLHSRIYNTVDRINEYFGPFLLSYIVQQFLQASYYIYWILLNKFSKSAWSSLDNASVLICAQLSFFIVSNSCHKIPTETTRFGHYLYDDKYFVLAEGQRLLLQITNQPIKITAMEFYKLDRSFFAALTVGGITSAIMLVQFQNN